MQNIIVIGDTHFGIKNNNMTWCNHQMLGFDEIIEYIRVSVKIYPSTTVIHVGDLFESRSSINHIIYKRVAEKLERIDSILGGDNKMFIIGGNHDYYYPNETKNNFTGIQMLPKYNNIRHIVDESYVESDMLMIPWFEFHNPEKLSSFLKDKDPDKHIIFTHTDPIHIDDSLTDIIKGYQMITGHIHTPERLDNILITGASFPINFSDANSERGFWSMADNDMDSIQFHPIHSSIHFHNISEQDIVDWRDKDMHEDDYVNILIKPSNIECYKDEIKAMNDIFQVSISYIPESYSIDESYNESIDIDALFEKTLPENLTDIYERMKGDISES